MKYIVSLIVILFSFFFSGTYAEENAYTLNSVTETGSTDFVVDETKTYFSVFTRPDCLHCIDLKKFLDVQYATWSIAVRYYNIDMLYNKLIYTDFVEKNNLSKITPILFIGNTVIEWFNDEQTTWKSIIEAVNTLEKNSFFEDPDIKIKSKSFWKGCTDGTVCADENEGFYVNIPFIWVKDLKDYSLPILAIILWFIDGFNPCAMWVLVMFLSILSQTGSRKKMVQIAWIFIIAEAVMYFWILNVWYKTWDFVKLDNIITPIIGLISIGAWIFFLYEFFTNKDAECKVTSTEQKKKTVEKIRYIVNSPMSIWIFFATIWIAFSVNIIEFACSIGIPQAFTKLLEMSSLWFFEKEIYVLLYTLLYMFDDVLVFWIAIYAFQYLHLTTKYTRYCLALGWILMILLWYLFIFNPVLLKTIIS